MKDIDSSKTSLILGAGSIGKRHAENLVELGWNVTFVRRSIDKKLKDSLKVKCITYEELRKSKNRWSVGFICTPTNRHVQDINLIDKYVDKIFLEKPLGNELSSLEALDAGINPKKIFIGFMLRFHPSIQKLMNVTKKKGRNIIYADFHFGSYLPSWHPDENYKLSYASVRELGGGVVRTICHEIDLVIIFFGLPISINADYSGTSRLNIDCEELVNIRFNYRGFSVNIHLNYLERNYHRFIKIFGEEFVLEWDWNENTVLYNKNLLQKADGFKVNQLYMDELLYFLSQKEFVNNENLVYAIKLQKIIDVIEESNKTGKRIYL